MCGAAGAFLLNTSAQYRGAGTAALVEGRSGSNCVSITLAWRKKLMFVVQRTIDSQESQPGVVVSP